MMTAPDPARSGHVNPLIVCADDFGMNAAANRAILDLAARGRLSATSCLVDGPFFEAGAHQLRDVSLQKGLHLNFTDDLGQPGLHHPLKTLILTAYLGRLDPVQVRTQIVRQLDRYESTMGAAPDYVDGHLHVHQLPQIREALVAELKQRYAGKAGFWVRSTIMRDQPALPGVLRLKARIIQQLGAKALAQLCTESGLKMNAGFLGVYNFKGGADTYAKFLAGWIQAAKAGDVLMCHPERFHPEDRRIDPQRNAEFDVLTGDAFARQLKRHGLALRV